MNDVKRHSRNLRSDKTRAFNLKSLEDDSDFREVKVKREFERRLESIQTRSEDEDEYMEDKMSKLESFVRDGEEEKESNSYFINFKTIALAVIVSLGFLYLLFTYVLNKATIEVEPKVFEFPVNNEIVLANTPSDKAYELVEINKESANKIEKLDKKRVVAKATGELIIYNNFDENTQKLVKNTRFESSNGKIFRITDPVVIPGMLSGKAGSVRVKVVADFAGEDYNIPAGKFTIPGFKGSARYQGFTAESLAPMSGGSDSVKNVISDDYSETLKNNAREELTKLILSDIDKVTKTDYILAKNIYDISFTDNMDKIINQEDDTYRLSAKGRVLLINEKYLAKAIASKVYTGYANEGVSIVGSDNGNLTINLASTSTTSLSTDSLLLKVMSSSTKIVFDINKDQIVSALVGKSGDKNTFSNIMSTFTGVYKAKPVFYPIWLKTFPVKESKIDVVDVSNYSK